MARNAIPSPVDPKVRELNSFNSSKVEPPAAQRLGEIKVPTLVINGEFDQPEVNITCDMVAAGIPGATKVMMPGVAHLPPMEQPAGFNALVLDF